MRCFIHLTSLCHCNDCIKSYVVKLPVCSCLCNMLWKTVKVCTYRQQSLLCVNIFRGWCFLGVMHMFWIPFWEPEGFSHSWVRFCRCSCFLRNHECSIYPTSFKQLLVWHRGWSCHTHYYCCWRWFWGVVGGVGVIAANSCLPIVTGVERLTRFARAACDIM